MRDIFILRSGNNKETMDDHGRWWPELWWPERTKKRENATLSFLAGVAIKVNLIGGSGAATSHRFKIFKRSKV